MRLIDGNGIGLALVIRGQSDKRFKLGDTIRYNPSEVQQIINEDMPTVDAVEVVRCKNCCCHEDEKPCVVWCPRVGAWVYNDWYCADGIPKGGDE